MKSSAQFLTGMLLAIGFLPLPMPAAVLTGRITDAATGQVVPARIYIQNQSGQSFFPESASPNGSAVRYEKRNWNNHQAAEYHTTLSAHPFQINLDPGDYTVTVERGHEYRPLLRPLTVLDQSLNLDLPLVRWVNMAERGWYSGDTHVHRTLEELPNVMLAEDLNVALPLTAWVTKGGVPPTRGDKTQTDHADAPATLIPVDATHVIYPRNTEYEIFSMGGKSHTLGALFVLNHQSPLTQGAPPLSPVVAQARAEHALLDLDKHNWPWSLALIPIARPDLFELANNHHWRTVYALTNWALPAPPWMDIGPGTADERQWTRYGFQTYYTLLNCGFPMRPSAGTASGVHPVPLGYNRVYVHLPGGFSYEKWIQGLDAGRSFVTTGPMLLTQFNGQPPGHRFSWNQPASRTMTVSGTILSQHLPGSVEIIRNGQLAQRLALEPTPNDDGALQAHFQTEIPVPGSSWMAVRCWVNQDDGRTRFAHTAPVWIEVDGSPLRPVPQEVQWLIQRVEEEIERSRELLSPEALAEYQTALAAYRALLP